MIGIGLLGSYYIGELKLQAGKTKAQAEKYMFCLVCFQNQISFDNWDVYTGTLYNSIDPWEWAVGGGRQRYLSRGIIWDFMPL